MSPEYYSLSLLPTPSSIPLPLFFLLAAMASAVLLLTLLLSPPDLAAKLALFKTRRPCSYIPGPTGLPVLGLVLAFSTTSSLTHRTLSAFSKTCNAVKLMSFSVGFTRFVISSHPDTARELLHSRAFANRPLKQSAYELLFHRAIGFAPYGTDYWRNLRKISATHLFSPSRMAGFGPVRTEIGLNMVEEIKGLMGRDGVVEVKRVLHFGSLNNVMMSVFGKCYDFGGGNSSSSSSSRDGLELESIVSEGYELLGMFNWSDHFPVLCWLDFQGVRRRCRELVGRVNVFVGKIIEEHRVKRAENIGGGGGCGDQTSGDFVDVLLDLESDSKLSDTDMIAVLWEMIFRGTDTVAILLEWIIARMVLHPDIQGKAQSEIDSVLGSSRRVVLSDSDLPNLPYLQAIVKETLRMHPPGPLLSWARLAIHDTHVGGHFISAGTTAMVNMWAITHDEKLWPEPNKFKPERFMEEDVAVMGSDLRLAPFGSGRRVCPGKAMGLAMVQLWLAQLVQSFKWVAADSAGVDLSEVLKLSMEMKHPLVCKALPRRTTH